MEKISHSLAETEQIAIECLEQLARGNYPAQVGKATLVGLEGDLGSGKTTFTQAVARQLGIRASVQSPTFVIIKTYSIPRRQGVPRRQGESLPFGKDSPCQWPPCQWPWRRLVHIDCYRLGRAEDLLRLGWRELAADPANLILVEWPERVGDLLSSPTLIIKFEVLGETKRKIIYG